MSTRNLAALFQPQSVALLGASRRPGSIGAVLARNLFNSGFQGPILPVHPRHRAVQGVLTYPDVASLPVTPDLAVICTPADTVPDLLTQLGERGTRAAIIISRGQPGPAGAQWRQRLLEAARPYLMRILGPNGLGAIVPRAGLNASVSHMQAHPGGVAFVTQSGAIMTSIIDWAASHGTGFSHLVALGDMSDVDFGDMLDYLVADHGTSAILLHVEVITNVRKFMSAARAAARMKPVIVIKGGRHVEAARAAESHTGAVASSDAVYDAAFRRAGMLRVHNLDDLFSAAGTLALSGVPGGERMAILSNGGGMGVMATDVYLDNGGVLAELSEDTLTRLDAVLPAGWARENPVDIIGDAPGERYANSLEVLMEAPEVDAVMVINCPVAIADSEEAALAVARCVAAQDQRWGRHRMVLTSWVGEATAAIAREHLSSRGVPTFRTPLLATRAFMQMLEYRRNQEELLETPRPLPEDTEPDVAEARAIIRRARDAGNEWLTEDLSKQLLAAFDIPVVATHPASTPEHAREIAETLTGPYVVKLRAEGLVHKSDVGGVRLNLRTPEAVEIAARDMARQLPPAQEHAGFAVQPMVTHTHSYELFAGVIDDAQFGPVIVFGDGGAAVEVLTDQTIGLPPLNIKLARDLMARTRIYRQLCGYRKVAAADLDAIALTLIRLSRLVVELPEVRELDINPLLAGPFGVTALDARIRVASEPIQNPSARLAIRPYPRELEETVTLQDGRDLLLRPILPEDEHELIRTYSSLSPEELELRFFVSSQTFTHMTTARSTQIDYDREMTFVLTDPGVPGESAVHGVVSAATDPDNDSAEFAIIIPHTMTGLGLGRFLMERIIAYCRQRGTRVLRGEVLKENTRMLRLCRRLGFRKRTSPTYPQIYLVELELQAESSA